MENSVIAPNILQSFGSLCSRSDLRAERVCSGVQGEELVLALQRFVAHLNAPGPDGESTAEIAVEVGRRGTSRGGL